MKNKGRGKPIKRSSFSKRAAPEAKHSRPIAKGHRGKPGKPNKFARGKGF